MGSPFLYKLRRKVRRFGIDCSRFPESGDLEYHLRRFHAEIDTVFDVGANEGQYARELRANGFRGRIISFEPIEAPFKELEKASADDHNWDVVQCGLGKKEAILDCHITETSTFNSFLSPTEALRGMNVGAHEIRTEKAKVRKLFDVFNELKLQGQRLLLKIDTQGYEMAVLEGAGECLDRFAIVQVEMSLHPIYEGAPPFEVVVAFLRARGFRITDLVRNYEHPTSGELLEVDGIFRRVDGSPA